jgi:hypothetical protein
LKWVIYLILDIPYAINAIDIIVETIDEWGPYGYHTMIYPVIPEEGLVFFDNCAVLHVFYFLSVKRILLKCIHVYSQSLNGIT